MRSIEVGNLLIPFTDSLGIAMEDIVEIKFLPHQLEITTAYVNGAGELHNHTSYFPITITIPEN